MSEEQKVQAIKQAEKRKQGRRPGGLYFPPHSLKDAIRVPKAIWNYNAGNPFAILDLAQKLNYTPSSSSFVKIIRSSQRYALTEGSWQQDFTKMISLTPLGSSIVAPTESDDVRACMRIALEAPRIFKRINELLNGKIIPPPDVLKNTLVRNLHLPKADAEECYKVFMKNAEELKIIDDVRGKQYLRVDKLGISQVEVTPQEETSTITELTSEQQLEEPPIEPTPELQKAIPKVFISHSKNQNILDQLKTILEFGDFEYTIAEEVETSAIPIPDKVFGLMRECNCAIINVSADEEMKQEDNSFRINENVLIEIGAAFVHYNKRVILLVDKRIDLPSNLQGLYKCEYEGDELSFMVAMKLQKALTEFKKTLD